MRWYNILVQVFNIFIGYGIIFCAYQAAKYFVSYERRNESQKADIPNKILIYFFILLWSSIAGIGVHFIQDNHYNSFARALVVVVSSIFGGVSGFKVDSRLSDEERKLYNQKWKHDYERDKFKRKF